METTKAIEIRISYPKWVMAEEMGYTPLTTFWQDFCIADKFGLQAVRGTYRRCCHWKHDYKLWTEMILVLNHKIWQHHGKHNALANLYQDLWDKAQLEVDKWSDEQKEYYYSITD